MGVAKFKGPAGIAALRGHAEKLLCPGNTTHLPESVGNARKLLHELSPHEIELEPQNEELLLARALAEQRATSLDAALRELESLCQLISHDLRAPLRHINSYLSILSEDFGGSLPAEAHGLLDRSREATRRMGKLMDDLLELSKVSRAKMANDPVDLGRLATHVIEALRAAEPHRHVETVIRADLKVRGDQAHLTQMMWKLLENAWKFTSNSPAARIEVGQEMADDRVCFFVRDNGVGFDMEYAGKLFTAFQRLHGKEFEGNGIGLASVKRIIDRHRGTIWAESAPGEGTTIYFAMP